MTAALVPSRSFPVSPAQGELIVVGHFALRQAIPTAVGPARAATVHGEPPRPRIVQAAVTPESLAHLMLGLFEQWLDNGMPPKERWILELQGRLGNDANARALVPRIREWRSNLDYARGHEGLEMLARIGSDTALMLLSTFSEQKRYGDRVRPEFDVMYVFLPPINIRRRVPS